MKQIIAAVLLVMTMAVITASAGSYPTDPRTKELIQAPSYSGLAAAVLTVNSTNFDMRLFPVFSIYCAADAKIRNVAANGVKTGSVSEPIIAGMWNTYVTHPATPFAIISGASNCVLRRQPK